MKIYEIILQDLTKWIEQYVKAMHMPSTIEFYNKTLTGRKTRMVQMFLKVSDSLPLSIEIKDKFGNPAAVEGKPAWALTDAALGTLEVSEDGMSATFKPAGLVGSLKVQAKCDADLGEDVKEIMGELDIELLSGEAVVVAISAGAPQAQA